MGESRRKGILVFGKQPGRVRDNPANVVTLPGTNANPVYAVPVVAGGLRPDRTRADLPETSDDDARPGGYIQRAQVVGTVTILARAGAPGELKGGPLGLLFYEAMWAQAVEAAGGGLNLHTFTMGDVPPDPLGIWSKHGDDWYRFVDCYVNRFRARGNSGENVVCEMEIMGFNARHLGIPLVSGTDYNVLARTPRYKYIGSAVRLDTEGVLASGAADLMDAERVELEIDRSLEFRWGSSLTPRSVTPQRMVNFSAGWVEDAANKGWDWIQGAGIGSLDDDEDMTQDLLDGAFEVTFGRHPIDADRYLKFYSSQVEANWEYTAQRPDPDPAGGPFELDVSGAVHRVQGDTEVTVELVDDRVLTY